MRRIMDGVCVGMVLRSRRTVSRSTETFLHPRSQARMAQYVHATVEAQAPARICMHGMREKCACTIDIAGSQISRESASPLLILQGLIKDGKVQG